MRPRMRAAAGGSMAESTGAPSLGLSVWNSAAASALGSVSMTRAASAGCPSRKAKVTFSASAMATHLAVPGIAAQHRDRVLVVDAPGQRHAPIGRLQHHVQRRDLQDATLMSGSAD